VVTSSWEYIRTALPVLPGFYWGLVVLRIVFPD